MPTEIQKQVPCSFCGRMVAFGNKTHDGRDWCGCPLPSFEKVVIGDATLYRGDCRAVLPTLAGVDAVVTDPPYGIAGKWKGGFCHNAGWAKADAELEARNEWDAEPPSAADIGALLAIGAQHIIWGGNYFSLPLSRCWLVWNKPERGFSLAECEMAWTDFDNVARVFDCRRSDPDREHPTQKPVALMAWCVSKTQGTVADPYMGSGTTGVACARLGRKFIGIERDSRWFDLACRRIADAQNHLFAEGGAA